MVFLDHASSFWEHCRREAIDRSLVEIVRRHQARSSAGSVSCPYPMTLGVGMIRTDPPHGRMRAALATVIVAALGVALLAPSASAAPSTSLPVVAAPEVTWSACRDGFECAVMPAPLDHGDPQGAHIGISVIRLPAGEPSRRIGSLLVNPG